MSLFIKKLFAALALIAGLAVAVIGFVPSSNVYASSIVPDSSKICPDGKCAVNVQDANKGTIVSVIISIAQYATYVIVAISILFLVYGGFLYVTDNGSGDSAKKGQKVLVNAIIGLVIAILAYTIVSVVSNLVAGTQLTVGQ